MSTSDINIDEFERLLKEFRSKVPAPAPGVDVTAPRVNEASFGVPDVKFVPSDHFAPTPVMGTQVGGNHYTTLKIQPFEYAEVNGLGFMEGTVIKYVTRHRTKHGAEDIRKAINTLQKLLHIVYGES